MSSDRRMIACIAAFLLVVSLPRVISADSIDYGKSNPPWKPGKYYSVISRYNMTLNGMVMDIKKIRKEHDVSIGRLRIWHNDEKVKNHVYSSPFSGAYSCYLNYRTFGAQFANKNNGSVFRAYDSADVSFSPLDEVGRTVLTDAEPSWLRRVLFGPRSEEVSNREIAEKLQDADFMFREIFMTDGQNLDVWSWYFLGWKQRSAFNGDMAHHLDVYKKAKRDVQIEALEGISRIDRAKIKQQHVGSGIAGGWAKQTDDDLGYNVAQAEAKMMTYAIYGQQETRTVGDVWEIDSATLESFFPLQSKNRKPFSFSGGNLILKVASDRNGIVEIVSLPSGRVNGQQKRTDLRIEPRHEESEFRPKFTVNMWDSGDNYVHFTIDTMNEVCTKAEMHVVLRDYSGAVPKVEQLSLNDPDHRYAVKITQGSVVLHCEITTNIEDKE